MSYDSGSFGADARRSLNDGTAAPRGGRWLVIGAVLLVVVALGVAYLAFGRGKGPVGGAKAAETSVVSGDAKSGDASQAPSVTIAVPGRQLVDRTISATGSLAARVDMPIGVAGEGGVITAVLVQPGSWVRAGQVLATIDRSVQEQTAASLAAQVNVSRSDARIADAEMTRAASLVERGFISKADMDRKAATRDSANARVRVAEATLREAQARAARLAIRAPASGLVLTRNVEPGQVVSAGSGVLFRLARDGALELRAEMSEADLAAMHVGAPARVTPVGSTQVFSGEVWQVSPVVDPSTRQGIARIALRYDSALRPGGFAAASIVSGASSVPLLPESAVQSDSQGNFVYVVNARNEVTRQAIKVGQVSDAGVAIADGLSGTEKVVVSAGAFLNPGQKVVPVKAKKG